MLLARLARSRNTPDGSKDAEAPGLEVGPDDALQLVREIILKASVGRAAGAPIGARLLGKVVFASLRPSRDTLTFPHLKLLTQKRLGNKDALSAIRDEGKLNKGKGSPGRHLFAFCIRNNRVLNITFTPREFFVSLKVHSLCLS